MTETLQRCPHNMPVKLMCGDCNYQNVMTLIKELTERVYKLENTLEIALQSSAVRFEKLFQIEETWRRQLSINTELYKKLNDLENKVEMSLKGIDQRLGNDIEDNAIAFTKINERLEQLGKSLQKEKWINHECGATLSKKVEKLEEQLAYKTNCLSKTVAIDRSDIQDLQGKVHKLEDIRDSRIENVNSVVNSICGGCKGSGKYAKSYKLSMPPQPILIECELCKGTGMLP